MAVDIGRLDYSLEFDPRISRVSPSSQGKVERPAPNMDFRWGSGGRLCLAVGSSWLGSSGSIFGLEHLIACERRFVPDLNSRSMALCKAVGVVPVADLRFSNADDCGWCRTFLPSENQR